MNREKYIDLDKAMSKKIMSEFKGETTEVVCPDCKGKKCDGCKHTGAVIYEW